MQLVKAAVQAKGLCSMLVDFGVEAGAQVFTDASAAVGMVFRQGLSSRTRHIDVAYLWVQDEIVNKRLRAHKIPSRYAGQGIG